MDDDAIQLDLLRGLEGHDLEALKRALQALRVEVGPIVAGFDKTSVAEAEGRIRDVVYTLVFPETPPKGRRSKLLATEAEQARPGGARAHRRTVVRSFLLDHYRKVQTRREYEHAAAAQLSAEEVRADRRQRRQKKEQPAERVAVRSAAAGAEPEQIDAAGVTIARELIVRHLARLTIKYRVAVALELGFDVWPLVEELAAQTGEPIERLRARVGALRPGDPDASVRVLYPEGKCADLAKARESFRKRYERGLQQLVAGIRGES